MAYKTKEQKIAYDKAYRAQLKIDKKESFLNDKSIEERCQYLFKRYANDRSAILKVIDKVYMEYPKIEWEDLKQIVIDQKNKFKLLSKI